jgi:ion channel
VRALVGGLGLAALLIVLRDAFETIILPRRVQRRFRPTSLFYRASWPVWRGVANRLSGRFRDSALGWFGPLSLLVLLALWAVGIIFAFGALQWGAGSALRVGGMAPGFLDDVYFSGSTFFTLGLGDLVPGAAMAKVLTVTEAGLGFAFLAIVIGYLPVIYQAFSRREIAISMLDARAGSPPAAGELLLRLRDDPERQGLGRLLVEWERWSAEVLESHLSYPVLAYFRSQHGNQSWLAALTTVLDTSALVMVSVEGWCARQAELTFAMARHAAVDLAQVFRAPRPRELPERLTDAEFAELTGVLKRAGMTLREAGVRERLSDLRELYEPYVQALSTHLAVALPFWTHRSDRHDNWRAAPWKALPKGGVTPEHF